MPLIHADQTIVLAAVIIISVAISIGAERFRIGQLFSSALIVMVLGLFFVNLNLIPNEAALYSNIYTFVVPIALPLFLYEAEWSRLIGEAKTLAKIFLIGASGVIVGAILASLFIDLGVNTTSWAGTFSASYIGGTVNFVAVSTSLELPSDEIAIALAADTIVGIILLLTLVLIPGIKLIENWFLPEGRVSYEEGKSHGVDSSNPHEDNQNLVTQLTFAGIGIALSIAIFYVSTWLSKILNMEAYAILIITVIALLLANLFPNTIRKLRVSYNAGLVGMLAFFFIIGASANITELLTHGGSFIWFLTIIVTCHLIAIFFISRFFKFRLSEVIIASCACALGPTVAAGIASSKKWRDLITPGILVGVFGYAIANFVGVGLTQILGKF